MSLPDPSFFEINENIYDSMYSSVYDQKEGIFHYRCKICKGHSNRCNNARLSSDLVNYYTDITHYAIEHPFEYSILKKNLENVNQKDN